jgi:hypothetical protein
LEIGSQAIHASIDYKLDEAERSIEVDVSSLEDPDGSKADLIDGSIAELSIFQDTYGYYAQGVTPQTATLPDGWRGRLIPYLTTGTGGVTALCLEPHDLWISKAVAGRPKDREFCRALTERNLVEANILSKRLEMIVSLNPAVRKQVTGLIEKG